MAVTNDGLSFAELEKRVHAVPDGPSAALNTPRWLYPFNIVGLLGVVVGLLPSILILYFEPKMWMLYMAKIGLAMTCLGWAPVFVRDVWVLARSLKRWKTEVGHQMDHDLAEFRGLTRWLIEFPKELLEEHLHFARDAQIRLSSKLGLLAGSMEKLGAIPILIALGVQLKLFFDPEPIPAWQIYGAFFLAITYLIAWVGAHMRLRVQLYELLLAEALAKKGG